MANYFVPSAKHARKSRPVELGETELNTWFERDRAHVELRNTLTDEPIVEWWDEAVADAIIDGFLDPRDYHQSAYDYAASLDMLPSKGGAR